MVSTIRFIQKKRVSAFSFVFDILSMRKSIHFKRNDV